MRLVFQVVGGGGGGGETETDRQTDGQTERNRDTETETERTTDRQTERAELWNMDSWGGGGGLKQKTNKLNPTLEGSVPNTPGDEWENQSTRGKPPFVGCSENPMILIMMRVSPPSKLRK